MLGTSGARRRTHTLALLGSAVALMGVPATAGAAATNISTGKAYDLAVKTSLLSSFATAGPVVGPIVSNTRTHTSQSAASASTSLASATILSATVDTTNEGAHSKAQVTGASIFAPGLPTIDADVISAKADATCRNHGTVTGSSVGGTVTVNGTQYPIASPPNTVIPLGPAGSITLNEQTKAGNSITVNAIHVRSVLGSEVIVASAQAAVSNCV